MVANDSAHRKIKKKTWIRKVPSVGLKMAYFTHLPLVDALEYWWSRILMKLKYTCDVNILLSTKNKDKYINERNEIKPQSSRIDWKSSRTNNIM